MTTENRKLFTNIPTIRIQRYQVKNGEENLFSALSEVIRTEEKLKQGVSRRSKKRKHLGTKLNKR